MTATTASSPSGAPDDRTVVDIPFLVRGEVIEPGDDAVEHGGRVGLRFRTPDPRVHADRLTLPDARALRDLHDLPIDAVIDFLAELGPRLRLEDNPLMQAAYRCALEAGGLTEPVLQTVYDDLPGLFARDRLEGQAERVLGKRFLDGWVELGAPGRSTMRVRAIGTRQVHVIAGNVPVVAGMTVVRAALTKGDCLIKMPSNDPFTAVAIVRSMIDLDPDHPVTRHFAVAYWKGGDEEVERRIFRPSRVEKLTAWGGMSSMVHINRYLVPGIELIALNPKLSCSIVGHAALEDDDAMSEAAAGVAMMAGHMNQTACSSTRLVYVECDPTDEADLGALERLGRAIHAAFLALPPSVSTAPKRPDRDLQDELDALAIDDLYYRVIGDAGSAGVIVSRAEEPVEFADRLDNRIVNLVPVPRIADVTGWVDESTQTIGIFPEALREALREDLALAGVQRTVPLGRTQIHGVAGADPAQSWGIPHDGTEPMRRMVRWVVDQSAEPR